MAERGTSRDDIEELYEKVRRYTISEKRRRGRLLALIAAALLIGSGVFGIIFSFFSILPGLIFLDSFGVPLVAVGTIHLAFGISSLASGILTLFGRRFRSAVGLAIPSIFILVFPGIAALVLILLCEYEFRS